MIYLTKQKAFSSKLGSKRIKYKYHDVKFLLFIAYQVNNDIGLVMDIDGRSQHIPLTLEEAESLLIDLTNSIDKVKYNTQPAKLY